MVRRSFRVRMSDGIELATDVYLPSAEGRYPVLLMMTPYGKGNLQVLADILVQSGYAVLVQDVRGRYDSAGEYHPIKQEQSDAPETIDWVSGQPWYDPDCGMGVVGISYLSTVGLICAAKRPGHIRVLLNIGGFADTYRISHRGGALVLHHMLPWSIITSYSPQPSLQDIDWDGVYRTLPLCEAAGAAGFDNQLWRGWMESDLRHDRWQQHDVSDLLDDIDVPILHISGWYDLCLGETLALYRHFAERACSPQHLIIGPWSHNGVLSGPEELSGVNFGPESRPGVPKRIISWFDRWLKGAEPSADLTCDQKPVAVFITGENRWLSDRSWPVSDVQQKEIYLADGSLSWDMPPVGGCGSYTYDPQNPPPTRGGAVWEFPAAELNPGPADQSELHDRDDLLVFASDPVSEPMTIAGPVSCELFACTDAETTDFVVKLLDIHPDGTARLICDGIVRGHLREDPSISTPLKPGQVHRFCIDMWSAGHTFNCGHRLGVEISGSSFPKWDRNLNSLSADRPTKARQKVYWGPGEASRLHLRVVK